MSAASIHSAGSSHQYFAKSADARVRVNGLFPSTPGGWDTGIAPAATTRRQRVRAPLRVRPDFVTRCRFRDFRRFGAQTGERTPLSRSAARSSGTNSGRPRATGCALEHPPASGVSVFCLDRGNLPIDDPRFGGVHRQAIRRFDARLLRIWRRRCSMRKCSRRNGTRLSRGTRCYGGGDAAPRYVSPRDTMESCRRRAARVSSRSVFLEILNREGLLRGSIRRGRFPGSPRRTHGLRPQNGIRSIRARSPCPVVGGSDQCVLHSVSESGPLVR